MAHIFFLSSRTVPIMVQKLLQFEVKEHFNLWQVRFVTRQAFFVLWLLFNNLLPWE